MSGPEFRGGMSFDEFVRRHQELIREKGDLVAMKAGQTVVEAEVGRRNNRAANPIRSTHSPCRGTHPGEFSLGE